MTITSEINEVTIPGNDSATVFSISPLKIFKILVGPRAGKHTLSVFLISEEGASPVEIQEGTGADKFAMVGTFSGESAKTGSIRYPEDAVTPLPTGASLVCIPSVPVTQDNSLDNQGGYFAKTQEGMFDRVTLILQQMQNAIDRSVKVDVGSGVDPADLIDDLEAAAAAAEASATASAASAVASAASASAAADSAAEAASSAGAGFAVGDIIMRPSSSARTGFLRMDDSTIGSGGSSADYAGSVYEPLYTYLWNTWSDTAAPVSSGRGASAAADFAANKTLTLRDLADRSPYGAGGDVTTGEFGGDETVASAGTVGTTGATSLSTAQLSSHKHVAAVRAGGLTYGAAEGTGSTTGTRRLAGADVFSDPALETDFTGGGESHSHPGGTFTGSATSVLHPVFGVYYFIKT